MIRRVGAMNMAALADVVLNDHLGSEHRLGDYWARQVVIVNFLRHFG